MVGLTEPLTGPTAEAFTALSDAIAAAVDEVCCALVSIRWEGFGRSRGRFAWEHQPDGTGKLLDANVRWRPAWDPWGPYNPPWPSGR